METKTIIKRLDRIEKLLVRNAKPILTVDDLINYSGYSRSYIYKLVHRKEIPFYKPGGKNLFFKREEINDWLLQNKTKSESEIEVEAYQYINSKHKK